MGTQLPAPKMGTAPQFSGHVYCGETAGWRIKMPLDTDVGLGQGGIVLDGTQLPHKNVAQPPISEPCGQTARCNRIQLGKEVGSAEATLCYMGTQLSPQTRHGPQFLVHVCCGETTGWIKMPLDTEVGLSPGDVYCGQTGG